MTGEQQHSAKAGDQCHVAGCDNRHSRAKAQQVADLQRNKLGFAADAQHEQVRHQAPHDESAVNAP
jgi:hypothetical protein